MAHPPQTTGWRSFGRLAPRPATVINADGRHRRRNGRPLANALSLGGEGVGALEARLGAPSEGDVWDYRTIVEATRVDFAECPICGSVEEPTDEHVPPQRLGGGVLTTTCGTCNNMYGSYEDALLQRAEQRYTMVLRGPSIVGERHVPDVITRTTPDGSFVITTWNGDWPDAAEPLFTNDDVEWRLEQRCECLAYAALLKNGYLAACALNPGLVDDPGSWPVAQLVREQLLSWRTPTDGHLELDSKFRRLHVRYSAPLSSEPGVSLCEATHRTTGRRLPVIRLGYQLVIGWPVDAATAIMRFPAESAVGGPGQA